MQLIRGHISGSETSFMVMSIEFAYAKTLYFPLPQNLYF